MRALIARLREPSTYAGIATVLGALGFSIDPGLGRELAQLGMAAAGAAAMLLPEARRRRRAPKPKSAP